MPEDDDDRKPGRRGGGLQDLARYAGLLSWGLNTAVALGLGVFGGGYLDRRFGTEPWLTVTGSVLAVLVSLSSLIRELLRLERRPPRRRR